MKISDFIDKDMRNMFLIIGGLAIFLIFIVPNIFNGNITESKIPFISDIVNQNINNYFLRTSENNEQVFKVDQNKYYKGIIETSIGNLEIDFFASQSPVNVGSVIGYRNYYKVSNIKVDNSTNNIIIDVQNPDIFPTEIYPQNLDLDKKVSDSNFLERAFTTQNDFFSKYSKDFLNQNSSKTLRELYESEFGYSYSEEDGKSTNKVKRYTVLKDSNGFNKNTLDLIIVLDKDTKKYDGLYTPIGEIVDGKELLNKITKDVIIREIYIEEV